MRISYEFGVILVNFFQPTYILTAYIDYLDLRCNFKTELQTDEFHRSLVFLVSSHQVVGCFRPATQAKDETMTITIAKMFLVYKF